MFGFLKLFKRKKLKVTDRDIKMVKLFYFGVHGKSKIFDDREIKRFLKKAIDEEYAKEKTLFI